MPSNIINLNVELAARGDERALTPKQEITVELRNHYLERTRLRRAAGFHRLAHKQRVKQFIEISELIETQEEKLLKT